MNLTFFQTVKVWWSYMWRQMALMLPLMIVVVVGAAFLLKDMPNPEPGQPPQLPGWFGLVIWLVMMPVSLAIQIFALRWALSTGWSDFRLVIAPPKDPNA